MSFGAYAVTHGWPAGLTILMSLVVFSGSAQFAIVTAFAGGGLGPALVSASLINLRFVPMAAATSTSLRGSRWRRALESLTLAPRRLLPIALAGAAVAGVSCRFLPTGVALILTSGASLLALLLPPAPQDGSPAPHKAPAWHEGSRSREGSR